MKTNKNENELRIPFVTSFMQWKPYKSITSIYIIIVPVWYTEILFIFGLVLENDLRIDPFML